METKQNNKNEQLNEIFKFNPRPKPKRGRKIDYNIDKEAIKILYEKIVYPVIKEAFEDLEDRIDDLFFLAFAEFEKNHGVPLSELEMIREKIRARIEEFKTKKETEPNGETKAN